MSQADIYACVFSPPDGDDTLNISQNIEKMKKLKLEKYSLYCNTMNLYEKPNADTRIIS